MQFANGSPMRPETNIVDRVYTRRLALGLTQKEVAERVHNSELYGTYTHSAYRSLETQDFENHVRPRNTLNKQLVIALSEALECQVSDLATEYELEAIRVMPYRRAQWPNFALEKEAEEAPSNSVPSPDMTAKRLHAYLKQHGLNSTEDIGRAARRYYIEESNTSIYRTFSGKSEHQKTRAKVLSYENLARFTTLLRSRGTPGFRTEWLLQCTDMCPHCDERLIYY